MLPIDLDTLIYAAQVGPPLRAVYIIGLVQPTNFGNNNTNMMLIEGGHWSCNRSEVDLSTGTGSLADSLFFSF